MDWTLMWAKKRSPQSTGERPREQPRKMSLRWIITCVFVSKPTTPLSLVEKPRGRGEGERTASLKLIPEWKSNCCMAARSGILSGMESL